MQVSEEKKSLTTEVLLKIEKLAKSVRVQTEVMDVPQSEMHEPVIKCITQIFQVLKNNVSD